MHKQPANSQKSVQGNDITEPEATMIRNSSLRRRQEVTKTRTQKAEMNPTPNEEPPLARLRSWGSN